MFMIPIFKRIMSEKIVEASSKKSMQAQNWIYIRLLQWYFNTRFWIQYFWAQLPVSNLALSPAIIAFRASIGQGFLKMYFW